MSIRAFYVQNMNKKCEKSDLNQTFSVKKKFELQSNFPYLATVKTAIFKSVYFLEKSSRRFCSPIKTTDQDCDKKK